LAERGELERKIASQHFHAAFAGAIRGEVRKRKLFMHGTDVDDLAAGLCLNAILHERLGDEEDPF